MNQEQNVEKDQMDDRLLKEMRDMCFRALTGGDEIAIVSAFEGLIDIKLALMLEALADRFQVTKGDGR